MFMRVTVLPRGFVAIYWRRPHQKETVHFSFSLDEIVFFWRPGLGWSWSDDWMPCQCQHGRLVAAGYRFRHSGGSYLGLYSLSRKTSYRKISWSLEVARFGFRLFQLLWNLTDACQISVRNDHYNTQSRGFETSRDLAVRRLTAMWIEAQYRDSHNKNRTASWPSYFHNMQIQNLQRRSLYWD